MSDVTVYGIPQSSFVRTVRMVLEEKGVAYTNVPMMPHTPELQALNPFGKVPAFGHGAVTLYETLAIVSYVDRTFQGPALFPDDPAGQAEALKWISVFLDTVYPVMVRQYLFAYLFPGDDGPDRARIDGAMEAIATQLDRLDDRLSDVDYLAGPVPGAADYFYAPVLSYNRQYPEVSAAMAARPAVARWYEALAARPSYGATMPPPPPG